MPHYRNGFEASRDWYKKEDIARGINQADIPDPSDKEKFAAWLTEQYQLACMKGWQLRDDHVSELKRQADALRAALRHCVDTYWFGDTLTMQMHGRAYEDAIDGCDFSAANVLVSKSNHGKEG